MTTVQPAPQRRRAAMLRRWSGAQVAGSLLVGAGLLLTVLIAFMGSANKPAPPD
jgi:hypothetical protein